MLLDAGEARLDELLLLSNIRSIQIFHMERQMILRRIDIWRLALSFVILFSGNKLMFARPQLGLCYFRCVRYELKSHVRDM